MKYLFFSLLWLFACEGFGQQGEWKIDSITLPAEIKDPRNEFSGLFIWHDSLYLLSESRIQDKHEARIYVTSLAGIDSFFRDSAHQLSFEKIPVLGLGLLSEKMRRQHQEFEGLEAMTITDENVYLSVETKTPASLCYLLKGKFKDGALYLDRNCLAPLPKPRKPGGEAIDNAGFESMMIYDDRLYAFCEYNYFEPANYVCSLDTALNDRSKDQVAIAPLPFRITDITHLKDSHYAAINYFYKGDKDTDYRPFETDTLNYNLVHDINGFHSYCRLIDIDCSSNPISWKPIWEFPAAISGFNWEGIASYNNGFFIINDKFTPSKPYASTLLYLHP